MSRDTGRELALNGSSERAMDELIAGQLALVERSPDESFVAKVDHAVLEWQRYRRWRASLWRQLVSEGLSIATLGGSLAVITQAPTVRLALVEMPMTIWPALISLLLLWVIVARGGERSFV